MLGWNSTQLWGYENTGSATSPIWTRKPAWDATLTKCTTLSGDRPHAQPSLGDLDGDGDLDLMTGSFDGCIEVLANVGTRTAPSWARAASWEPTPAGRADSNVALGDLDGDGDLDLIIGYDVEATPYRAEGYRNDGSASGPIWVANPAWDVPVGTLHCCGGNAPELGDLDNDGDLDLVMFEDTTTTGLAFYENTGTRLSPTFTRNTTWTNLVTGENDWFLQPALGDLDGDGKLDLLVGKRSYSVYCTGAGCNATGYRNETKTVAGGKFESATIDLASNSAGLAQVRWTSREPSQTGLWLQLAGAAASAGPFAYLNHDGSQTAIPGPAAQFSRLNSQCQTDGGLAGSVTCPVAGSAFDLAARGNRYLRYQAMLSSGPDGGAAPALDEVDVLYSQYPTASMVEQVRLASGHSSVRWVSLEWVRVDAASVTNFAELQVKVAPSQAALTSAPFLAEVLGATTLGCTEAPGRFGVADPLRRTVRCDLTLPARQALLEPGTGNGSMELRFMLASDGSGTPLVEAARASFVEAGGTPGGCQ
jgi:hypothetical protein